MKIAIIADTHLGYSRFADDSFNQAKAAFEDAANKADIIVFAGDLFDMKIPKLEDLEKAINILGKVKIPIFAIHGNHERRTKGMVNPVKLLSESNMLRYLHMSSDEYSINGERIQITGIGSVPEDFAGLAVEKIEKSVDKNQNAFRILVIHQTIKELIPHSGDELSLYHLEDLPFDLIINGHIHKRFTRLGGKFIIPGSTVITQLKKDEAEPKGYVLYDTKNKQAEFIDIGTRKFFYEELKFENSGKNEVNQKIKELIENINMENKDAIISIKIKGTLREGLSGPDVKIDEYENVFLDNQLNSSNLAEKIKKIKDLREENLSIRDFAVKELSSKIGDNIKLFNPSELFDKLVNGTEEPMEYLEKEVLFSRNRKTLP